MESDGLTRKARRNVMFKAYLVAGGVIAAALPALAVDGSDAPVVWSIEPTVCPAPAVELLDPMKRLQQLQNPNPGRCEVVVGTVRIDAVTITGITINRGNCILGPNQGFPVELVFGQEYKFNFIANEKCPNIIEIDYTTDKDEWIATWE
jgi:hypothetical protein